MNMKEMGQNLRLGRERIGLSVDDVVQRTKISKVNVLALEAGDAHALPHPVYAKGFVRNYAKLLGLDPEEYAQALSAEFQAEDNVAPPTDEAAEPSPLDTDGGKWKPLVAGLVLLACIVGAVVYFYSGGGEPAPQPEPAAQVQPEPAPAPEAVPAAPAEPEPAQAEPAQPEAREPAETAPEPVAEPEAQPEPAVQPAPAEPEAEAAPAAQPEPAALAADTRQRVMIKAEEACWLQATVDGGEQAGGVLVDIMLQPGQTKLLRYEKSMVVKLGNAGGVRITLNGKPFEFDAQSGQVRTLAFPEE